MTDPSQAPGVRHRRIRRVDRAGLRRDDEWGIAVEAPVAITVNGAPWTVMLATPADLAELATGILLTERVLSDPMRIAHIAAEEYLDEFTVSVEIPADAIDQKALGARSLVSTTACGLCGIESLAELHRRRGEWQAVVPVSDEAIRRAMQSLPEHQPLNAVTRSIHAAAWCDLEGTILLVREDVGRHNALDKLVGALARGDRLTEAGFVLMSSRCSYELVYKAVRLNTQLLASISAPTSLALQWATQLGLPLVTCVGRADGMEIVRFEDVPIPDMQPPVEEVLHVDR